MRIIFFIFFGTASSRLFFVFYHHLYQQPPCLMTDPRGVLLLHSWLLVILYIPSFSERFSKNVQLIVALTKTFYLYDAFSMFLQHFGGQIVKSVEGKKSDKRQKEPFSITSIFHQSTLQPSLVHETIRKWAEKRPTKIRKLSKIRTNFSIQVYNRSRSCLMFKGLITLEGAAVENKIFNLQSRT